MSVDSPVDRDFSSGPGGPSDIASAVSLGINAVKAGNYRGALQLFRVVYEDFPDSAPTSGLSFYALCVARVDKQTKKAIALCERAIAEEFYDSNHYANLIRIYLHGNSRRRAVETLEAALQRNPKDPLLLAVREEMGYRHPPPIRFLHRDNPINYHLGKLRKRPKVRRAIMIVIGVIWFIALFGGTLYFLMRDQLL